VCMCLKRVACVSAIIYLVLMKRMARRAITSGLIAGYLLVAVSWQLEALGSFLNTSGELHHVTSARKSRPIDSRPYWTQWKHIPLSPKSGDQPQLLLPSAQVRHDPVVHVVRITTGSSLAPQSEDHPNNPRGPPSA
jgi:hypothetical protein